MPQVSSVYIGGMLHAAALRRLIALHTVEAQADPLPTSSARDSCTILG